jgi:phosphatidylserine decarboxylase
VAPAGLAIKTGTLQSVSALIGTDSKFADAFAGGTFTHLFLDVGDYHHYHFPLRGTIREVRILPGREVAGGLITWDAVNRRYAFDPSSVGWQALETRGSLILETAEVGLVALVPIGMSPVSSVTFEPHLAAGTHVRKGDVMGHFLFGGSDFAIVLQAGTALTSAPGASGHLLMGESLGTLRRNSR